MIIITNCQVWKRNLPLSFIAETDELFQYLLLLCLPGSVERMFLVLFLPYRHSVVHHRRKNKWECNHARHRLNERSGSTPLSCPMSISNDASTNYNATMSTSVFSLKHRLKKKSYTTLPLKSLVPQFLNFLIHQKGISWMNLWGEESLIWISLRAPSSFSKRAHFKNHGCSVIFA